MYKLCVFDMDGTLVDSIEDIAAAMNRSLKKMGRLSYPTEKYNQMVGDGMNILCKRALPDGTEDEISTLISLYKEDYLNNCCVLSKLYPGVAEMIDKLSKVGVKCAVLSNKPDVQVCEIAGKIMDVEKYFKIMGQTENFPIKPAPDSLLYLMKEAGADKSETAYIGDSNVDIRLGKAAGVMSVGVAWGLRGEAELTEEGADAIAHTAEELFDILTK